MTSGYLNTIGLMHLGFSWYIPLESIYKKIHNKVSKMIKVQMFLNQINKRRNQWDKLFIRNG